MAIGLLVVVLVVLGFQSIRLWFSARSANRESDGLVEELIREQQRTCENHTRGERYRKEARLQWAQNRDLRRQLNAAEAKLEGAAA